MAAFQLVMNASDLLQPAIQDRPWPFSKEFTVNANLPKFMWCFCRGGGFCVSTDLDMRALTVQIALENLPAGLREDELSELVFLELLQKAL